MNFPEGNTRTPSASVIITDLGGVLVDYDGEARNRKFVSLCRANPEEIGHFFRKGGSYRAFEKGTITPRQFFEAARAEIGFGGDFDEFRREYCNPAHFALIQEVFDLYFTDIKARNNVDFWLLSNINAPHYEYISARWPGIFSNCRRVYLSCELGLRKPDLAIYKKALELGGGYPYLCLFVDDLEENVEAARKCGIGAMRFESAEKLRVALAHNGFALGV